MGCGEGEWADACPTVFSDHPCAIAHSVLFSSGIKGRNLRTELINV